MFFMCILQCRRDTVTNIDWRDYEEFEQDAFEKMNTPTSKKKKSLKQIQEEKYNKRKVKNEQITVSIKYSTINHRL